MGTKKIDPQFTRGDVAKILNVTSLTVANREQRGQYPEPQRDLNNYRVYTLNDVLNLQLLTYQKIDPLPIFSVLFDKGYKDSRELAQLVDGAIFKRKGAVL